MNRPLVTIGLGLLLLGGTPVSRAEVAFFLDGFEGVDISVYSIDFCRLQFPPVIADAEGTLVQVYGRLYVAGLTDLNGSNNPAPEVIGYVGYGPDGTDPATGWNWTAALTNPAYGPGSPGHEVNNDEYLGVINVPSPPGNYDFAFRFSGDSGNTFTYCDLGTGSSDGYSADNAGQMTSLPNLGSE